MRRHRDRHGRAVGSGVWHSATAFEESVREGLRSLEPAWHSLLERMEVTIVDIPAAEEIEEEVPLARIVGDSILIYRHPITIRSSDRQDLAALILDVLIEQVAELAGIDPEEVDERYGESG